MKTLSQLFHQLRSSFSTKFASRSWRAFFLALFILFICVPTLIFAYQKYLLPNFLSFPSSKSQTLTPELKTQITNANRQALQAMETTSATATTEFVPSDLELLQAPAALDTSALIQYQEINTPYQAQIPDYQIAVADLDNLSIFKKHENKNSSTVFNAENLASLVSVHSFTTPELQRFYSDNLDAETMRTDDWISLYEDYAGDPDPCYRQLNNSVLITTDFMAHLYHRILQRQMEYLDKEEFYPRLKIMTNDLLTLALTEQKASNSENQTSWQRIVSFLSVAQALLNAPTDQADSDTLANAQVIVANLPITDQEKQLANSELDKIFAAAAVDSSTIFVDLDLSTDKNTFDYTQFQPRSYYNKNAVLRSYFRAMMWYGRSNFNLKSKDLTRDALNLTQIMNRQKIAQNWADIYEPTAFLVGTSDDLSFKDYMPYLAKGQTNDAAITTLQQQAKQLRQPSIMSDIVVSEAVPSMTEEELLAESLGWRIMGQRFTPDGFIFDRLTAGDTKPDPVTGEKLPSQATAAMVAAALGSQTAEAHLQTWISAWESQHSYKSQQVMSTELAKLRQYFTDLNQTDWTQNAYWSWMYLYRSLINDQKNWQGYPKFMSFANWRQKDLNTLLGSWTELKHDTLLYAKQSYAEMGGGGGECPTLPVPKGYIEPNIEFYDRLEALVTMIDQGLATRELLHPEIKGRTATFLEKLRFFRSLAIKELANQPISDDEFAQLQAAPISLSGLARVLGDEAQTERESRSALIADVQTDGVERTVTYEANGIPQTIYVAVSDVNGTRLVKGLVFSQYEFTQPLGGTRLTDETWWQSVYGEQKTELPALSPWSQLE